MKGEEVTVTTTAAVIVPNDGTTSAPIEALIRNDSATLVYLGGADVDDAGNGFSLAEDAGVSVRVDADGLYAVTASGTATVSIIRTGD